MALPGLKKQVGISVYKYRFYCESVSTVVALLTTALIGGGVAGAKGLRHEAEITVASTGEGASPMPMWGPNQVWPGSGLVLRSLSRFHCPDSINIISI